MRNLTRKDRWVQRWKVPRSDDQGFWTVAQANDGAWGCSCPRWKFRRELCHHIQAVQTNPEAYSAERPPQLPEIIPGNVEAVEIFEGHCLHPLIPISDSGPSTDVLATIVYDLLALGYSMGVIRSRFQMIPREWTVEKVQHHIRHFGRTLCKPGRWVPHLTEYVRMPLQEG